MNSLRKIALLGKNGLLGRAIFEQLSFDAEYEISATDLDDFDVRDYGQLKYYLEEFNPEIVINCVGFTNVDGAEKPEFYKDNFDLNAILPEKLGELSSLLGFKLIHFSTDYVFDGSIPPDTVKPICLILFQVTERQNTRANLQCKEILINILLFVSRGCLGLQSPILYIK